MKLNYAILYCCYNRPDLVKQSLISLSQLECKKIYIACDGAKYDDLDKKKCDEVKKIIKETSFLSEVEFNFSDKNFGCKIAISNSINWFFEREEEGVILEDDIIPSHNFFEFCQYSLKKYRNNDKIMMISGTNYLGNRVTSNKYFYSQHFIIWGWATWRRAWKNYDVNMKDWKDEKIVNKIKNKFDTKTFEFLKNRFNQFFLDYKDTWDIQWYFTCIKNDGLCVVPEANLIKNIGIHGTHSNKYYETLFLEFGKLNVNKIDPPQLIKVNKKFDEKIHKKFHFKNQFILKFKFFIRRLLKK